METANQVVQQVVVEENILQFLMRFMVEGGTFMYVIAFIWIIGLVIVAERFFYLRKINIDGPSFFSQIKRMVISNNVQAAIQMCAGTQAHLGLVLKNGLKRANQSRDQIQSALEGTILEVVPKIEAKLNYVAVLANMSTLFGLLGTIQGLIQSFGAVATAEANLKQQLLAKGIAVAMNTTAIGLLSSITLTAMLAYLSSISQRLVLEVDEYSIKLVDVLTTKSNQSLDEAV